MQTMNFEGQCLFLVLLIWVFSGRLARTADIPLCNLATQVLASLHSGKVTSAFFRSILLPLHYGKVSMGGVTFAFHWEFSTFNWLSFFPHPNIWDRFLSSASHFIRVQIFQIRLWGTKWTVVNHAHFIPEELGTSFITFNHGKWKWT